MKLYGLFLCTYDYYEWKDLCFVSSDISKLKAKLCNGEILADENHIELQDSETTHYVIEEVEFLD